MKGVGKKERGQKFWGKTIKGIEELFLLREIKKKFTKKIYHPNAMLMKR